MRATITALFMAVIITGILVVPGGFSNGAALAQSHVDHRGFKSYITSKERDRRLQNKLFKQFLDRNQKRLERKRLKAIQRRRAKKQRIHRIRRQKVLNIIKRARRRKMLQRRRSATVNRRYRTRSKSRVNKQRRTYHRPSNYARGGRSRGPSVQ